MLHFPCRRLWPAALLLAAVAVPAQPQPGPQQPARPDPLNAAAPVPPARYSSPFERYRRHADDKRLPWKEANETVGRIGGWRSYAREAQQAASAVPAAPAASSQEPR